MDRNRAVAFRAALASVAMLSGLTFAQPASSADSPAPAGTVASERLAEAERVLESVGHSERSLRFGGGTLLLVSGAAAVPLGFVLRDRWDTRGGNSLIGAGIGLGVGGVLQFLPLWGNTAQLAEAAERRRSSGMDANKNLELTEASWAALAEQARVQRQWVGYGGLGIGSL